MANPKMQKSVPIIIVVVGLVILLGSNFYKAVPPGHVGVATLFGNVRPEGYTQGLHIPVNPLYRWVVFDARQQTHLETANVPSQDQLQTKLDVSVQYRIIGSMAPDILEQTGNVAKAVEVHLKPKLRSLLREQGKSIKRAEDFFTIGHRVPALANRNDRETDDRSPSIAQDRQAAPARRPGGACRRQGRIRRPGNNP